MQEFVYLRLPDDVWKQVYADNELWNYDPEANNAVTRRIRRNLEKRLSGG